MFRYAFLSALLLSASAAGADPIGTQYAFLVGCSGYNKTQLRELSYTINDVTDFKKALLATGFEEDNIKLLHDKRERRYLPEKAKIQKELGLLLDGVKPADTVIVAISGHGVHFKNDKAGYFCPLDADINDKKTLLAMEGPDGLFNVLKACKAKKKLLIVNACRNDPFADLAQAANKGLFDDVDKDEVPEGIAAIYACKDGQKSYFDPNRQRGIFFDHVIRAWQGEYSRNTSPKLEDFFDQVVRKTKNDADQTLGVSQVPQVRREYRGEWLIGPAKVVASNRRAGNVVEVEIAKGVKMKFCWAPAGEAQLGSPRAERQEVWRQLKEINAETYKDEPKWLQSEAEDLRGKFKTKGFWFAKYTVTQEEWAAVMGKNPSWFSKEGGGKDKVAGKDTSRYPVESVSWNDCQDFLEKVNRTAKLPATMGKGKFALPHEDEWEYACRGGKGNKQAFYFGDELNGKQANCDGNYPYGTTTKGPYLERTTLVGSYETEAPHPWGLCDMSGNVYQWCENWYDGEQKSRVVRGGSWYNYCRYCRSAYRLRYVPGYRNYYFGCRVSFRLD